MCGLCTASRSRVWWCTRVMCSCERRGPQSVQSGHDKNITQRSRQMQRSRDRERHVRMRLQHDKERCCGLQSRRPREGLGVGVAGVEAAQDRRERSRLAPRHHGHAELRTALDARRLVAGRRQAAAAELHAGGAVAGKPSGADLQHSRRGKSALDHDSSASARVLRTTKSLPIVLTSAFIQV